MIMSLAKTTSACVMILMLCSSCATSGVWEKYNPNELNRMPANPATEEHIERHGLSFESGIDEPPTYYMVEKTTGEKVTLYTWRTLLTPLALATDTILSGSVLFLYLWTFLEDPLDPRVWE